MVSPLLLVAFGFLGVSTQAIMYDHKDRTILGKTIKKEEQLKLACMCTVRSVLIRSLHSRMPLVPTPARFKRVCLAFDTANCVNTTV
jgi:hypothetical protein